MLITENTAVNVPDRLGGVGSSGVQWGFSQVDIRVCFKQPGRVGNTRWQRTRPGGRSTSSRAFALFPAVSWAALGPCPGEQAPRAGGSRWAWAQSSPHGHCPACTVIVGHREAQPLLLDLGTWGPSASPEDWRAKATPLEVRPLVGTGAPEPHRGQCSASSPRADSGRPGQGESLLRRPSEVVVSQAGRLSGERLTSGCHRGRADSARQGRWSRRSGR